MPALINRAAAGTLRLILRLVGDGLGPLLGLIARLFVGVMFEGMFDIVNRWEGGVVMYCDLWEAIIRVNQPEE